MFRLRLLRLTLSERELLFILALESILCALFVPWCPILLYVGIALAPFSSFSRVSLCLVNFSLLFLRVSNH